MHQTLAVRCENAWANNKTHWVRILPNRSFKDVRSLKDAWQKLNRTYTAEQSRPEHKMLNETDTINTIDNKIDGKHFIDF